MSIPALVVGMTVNTSLWLFIAELLLDVVDDEEDGWVQGCVLLGGGFGFVRVAIS